MPPKNPFNRADAISQLVTSAEFRRIYNASRKRPLSQAQLRERLNESGTPQIRRYASKLRDAQKAGTLGDIKHLGQFRGHTAHEGHAGRARKRGWESYQPPAKIERGTFPVTYDRHFNLTMSATVTAGEARALREIIRAASKGEKVTLNLTGGKTGQFSQLLWKGGWDAESLLSMAGYQRKGRQWRKLPDAPGLEGGLIEYLATVTPSPGHRGGRWGAIKLYEVYRFAADFDRINLDDRDVATREIRTDSGVKRTRTTD